MYMYHWLLEAYYWALTVMFTKQHFASLACMSVHLHIHMYCSLPPSSLRPPDTMCNVQLFIHTVPCTCTNDESGMVAL